jgi:hypothetical protein
MAEKPYITILDFLGAMGLEIEQVREKGSNFLRGIQ